MRLPLAGAHQVANFLAAAAIAFAVGLPRRGRAAAAAQLRPAAHRGEWRRHASGARALRRRLQREPGRRCGRRSRRWRLPGARGAIAVLGDMLELGRDEEPVAPRARALVAGARRSARLRRAARARVARRGRRGGGAAAGARRATSRRRRTPRRCSRGCSRRGDVVLFKASRGVGLERAVGAALADAEAKAVTAAMLYWLLFPLAARVSGLQRLPVHHVPDGDGGA